MSPPPPPSLNALQAFDAFARDGSVAGAASELGVTSGAVSRHISALNKDLGVALVERDGRGLRLTAAGRNLARSLEPAFAEIQKAVSVTRSPTVVRGTVSLSVAMMFAKAWLIPRLSGFGEGEVDFIFNDDPGASDRPTPAADLVITWGRQLGDDEYTAAKFGEERAFPVCSPGLGSRIVKRNSFAGVPLLHYSDIPSGWDWPTWPVFFRSTGIDSSDAGRGIQLSRGLIMDAARDGQGLALANNTLVHDDIVSGRLMRPVIASMPLDSGYWLLTPQNRPVRPEVMAFRDWLRSEYAVCFGMRPGFVGRTAASGMTDARRHRA